MTASPDTPGEVMKINRPICSPDSAIRVKEPGRIVVDGVVITTPEGRLTSEALKLGWKYE